ncbi:hypothetical protein PQR64_23055 [Paraburkholderia phytofirmans]|uniref:hypothetical protein n=1 Tax=Paraburkholderia phytofirmans TaxID=261302 RepID=UPI0038B779F4
MSTLNDVIAQFTADADTAHEIVHGDSTTTVPTEGGPVRSISKLVADNQALIDAALGLNQRLLQWAYATSFQLVSVTRDINSAIVTASIVWPDGGTGIFTTDTASTTFPGAIDAWHATYVNGSVSHTITQPAVTRDVSGAVTAQPAVTIA